MLELHVELPVVHAQHRDGVDVEGDAPDPEEPGHLRELAHAGLKGRSRPSGYDV